MQKERLILPVAILLASIVIGGFYYASQVNKQKSIEKQQIIKIEEERRKSEEKATKEQAKEQELEATELEAKKNKCFSDAKKFHEDYIKTIGGGYQYFEPKFGYNKLLDKCLYSGGYTNGGKDWGREVKDIHTNETLLMTSGLIADALSTSNSAEKSNEYLENFWSEHSKLFNE